MSEIGISEEVDFEIEKEVWNIYELADGTVLKARCVLFKLLRTPIPQQPGKYQYQGAFQNIVMVKSKQKGTPSNQVYPPDELAKMPKSEVNYTTVLEEWNIYRVPDGLRAKVKMLVSSIYRLRNLFDRFGDPMYILQTSQVIAPVEKP
jgi:hypothetical protein